MSHEKLLQTICSIPTAPFAEGAMIRFIEDFAAARKRVTLSRDGHGNRLLEISGTGRGAESPRWVFAAHMDHPGFVAAEMLDARTLRADFRGWVHIDYLRDAKVRFFPAEGPEIRATVIEASGGVVDRMDVADRVTLRVARPVPTGSPGMFDQGAGRFRGRRFYSRGCDDQAGVASALACLDDLIARRPRHHPPVAVLLTRAEEEGFIGAIAACIKPRLLRRNDRVISIETSAMQPYAKQGDGVILRVGDKTSIFNSDLSYFIAQQAEAIQNADPDFAWYRALMPGGTCEATVYDVYGYCSAAVCVPLGNYHNMDRARNRIGPEYIHTGDWNNLVKLLSRFARHGHTFSPGQKLLRQRLSQRFEKLKALLRNP